MKAQLSLELLVYMSLAGLSFLFAISSANRASANEARNLQIFETSQFVGEVNAELMSGSASIFRVFLPRVLCNSTLSGRSLLISFGDFYFYSPVNSSSGALCPDGVYASLSLSYSKGIALLERVG